MRYLLLIASLLSSSSAATAPATEAGLRPPSIPASSADLNGDGIPDLVTGAGAEIRISLSGAGQFRLPQARAVVAFVLSDADGDADPDLIVLSRHGSLQLWSNNGRGHFKYQQPRSQPNRFGSSSRRTIDGGPLKDVSLENSGSRFDVLPRRAAQFHSPDRAGPADAAVVVRPPSPAARSNSDRAPPVFFLTL